MGPIHPSLAALARAAKARQDLAGVLADALRRPDWLRPEHRVGDPARYMRHLLYVDPADEFVITAITWLPGQRSSTHGHYVWCAYGVAEGELTEELFDQGLAVLKTRILRRGDLADPDLDGKVIHRVANSGRTPVVSLHLYGVAAGELTTGINRLYPS